MYDSKIDLDLVEAMTGLLRYEQNETGISTNSEDYFRNIVAIAGRT